MSTCSAVDYDKPSYPGQIQKPTPCNNIATYWGVVGKGRLKLCQFHADTLRQFDVEIVSLGAYSK